MIPSATIDDLHCAEGKAELIAARIVHFPLHTIDVVESLVVLSLQFTATQNRFNEAKPS